VRRVVFSLALTAAMISLAADAFAAEDALPNPPVPAPIAPPTPAPAKPLAPSTQSVPATQPAGGAAAHTAAQLQKWLADLDNTQPSIRESARVALLQLSRDELALLREIIQKNGSLTASQSTALHDVVIHVFLTGEPYTSNPGTGFLGVRLAEEMDNAMFIPESVRYEVGGELKSGVLVLHTMPGFCAFTALREGDVVLAIAAPNPVDTPEQEDLVNAISSIPAGRDVTLTVLRQGQTVKIPLRLSARPLPAGKQADKHWLEERQAAAEQYWQTQFASLVGAGVS